MQQINNHRKSKNQLNILGEMIKRNRNRNTCKTLDKLPESHDGSNQAIYERNRGKICGIQCDGGSVAYRAYTTIMMPHGAPCREKCNE